MVTFLNDRESLSRTRFDSYFFIEISLFILLVLLVGDLIFHYSTSTPIRAYNFELSLFMLLCDKVVSVIRVLVLNTRSKSVRNNTSTIIVLVSEIIPEIIQFSIEKLWQYS